MDVPSKTHRRSRRLLAHVLRPILFLFFIIGCARLPVPIQVMHEDQNLLIRTERVSDVEGYSHPLSLKADDIVKILSGISAQERLASWPLRLFGKDTKPERLFSEGQIQVLAPYLADGLRAAKQNERVAFALYAPGPNSAYERYVTSGWIAVRDPFLHIALEYVRSLQPRSPTRNYYPFYPEMPSAPPPSDVFFEPHEFWMADPVDGNAAVQFRDYLRSASGNEGS
jgi:hypothetical protein